MIDDSVSKILAVDNEPHMLTLLERIISERTPYQIVTTSSSLEVPDILDKYRFSLIITDLKMPGMDGIDLLNLVKKSNRDEEVIIITAFASLETATKALELGVFDYLLKPFRKEQILSAVERAIHWQRMKTEHNRIKRIFSVEPYQSANEMFETEYINRFLVRCDNDIAEISKRSGLNEQRIYEILDYPSTSGD